MNFPVKWQIFWDSDFVPSSFSYKPAPALPNTESTNNSEKTASSNFVQTFPFAYEEGVNPTEIRPFDKEALRKKSRRWKKKGCQL